MRYRSVFIAAAGLLAVSGCSSDVAGPSGQGLEPADFRATTMTESTDPAKTKPAPPLGAVPIHQSEAEEHLVDIGVLVGQPPIEPSPALPPEMGKAKPVIVDSLVGQINGRPVYASEFLGPLEGRLRGLAVETRDEQQWVRAATQRIKEVLHDRLRDELFITEAQASLSPEQKKGLLHFIDTLRNNLVSTAGAGAAVAADEVYRERNNGQGLDTQVQKELDQQMVTFQVQTKVLPLVNVSWRDVQLEYNRRYTEFNPAATAMFLVIYIPDSKPEVLSEFTRRIEGGGAEDFAELAARPENEFPDKGSWPRKFEREFTEGKFFAYPEYENAAHVLKPGQTSPPIHLKNRTAWIHLQKIEKPPSKSLYDVQISLFNELHRQRLQEEADRYFARLMNKASFSDLNSMVAQLVSIAHDRYYVTQK